MLDALYRPFIWIIAAAVFCFMIGAGLKRSGAHTAGDLMFWPLAALLFPVLYVYGRLPSPRGVSLILLCGGLWLLYLLFTH